MCFAGDRLAHSDPGKAPPPSGALTPPPGHERPDGCDERPAAWRRDAGDPAIRRRMKGSRRRILLIAAVMIWLIAWAAWAADWMVGDPALALDRSLMRAPMCLFGAACCWAMALMLDRMAGWRAGARLTTALVLCGISAIACAALDAVVTGGIPASWRAIDVGRVLGLAIAVVPAFLVWSTLYFAVDGDARARRAQRRLAESEDEALRARHQALGRQLDPHFLFNALQAVSRLVRGGQPARAERLTVALSEMLRRSLESDGRDYVPLDEEIGAVRRYLAIEETRFENRLHVIERMAPASRRCTVPPMILQPLVENAVKHGVARSNVPVTLRIDARIADDRLVVTIEDDAMGVDGAASPGVGIGHDNVHRRLAFLYGEAAALEHGPRAGGGYLARITLPASARAAA